MSTSFGFLPVDKWRRQLDPEGNFTPTFEEFMWSFVKLPGHLLRGPSTEDMFYFNLHLLHFGAHYAFHAYRVGAYAAWDTFAGYRMSQMLSRPYRVAQFLASPVGAVGLGMVALGHGYSKTSAKVGGFASPAASGMGLSPGSTDYGPFGRHFN